MKNISRKGLSTLFTLLLTCGFVSLVIADEGDYCIPVVGDPDTCAFIHHRIECHYETRTKICPPIGMQGVPHKISYEVQVCITYDGRTGEVIWIEELPTSWYGYC